MISIVRKLFTSITLSASAYLFAATSTFAAKNTGDSINPCANNGVAGFGNLCGLGGNGTNGASHLIGVVVQLLLAAAVIISLIFLIIGGIRWVTSGGDKGKLDSARGTVV